MEVTLLRAPGPDPSCPAPNVATYYAARTADLAEIAGEVVPWDALPAGAGPAERARDRAAADLEGLPPGELIKLGWATPDGRWVTLA